MIGGQGSVAVSPHETYVIYAVTTTNQTAAAGRGNNLVYESIDGGRFWSELGNPAPQGRVPFVETNDRSTDRGPNEYDLWFGDVRLYRARGVAAGAPGGTQRVPTFNPGAPNWTEVQDGAHADAGALHFDAGIPKLYANDGGVYYSTAGADGPIGGATWQQPARTPTPSW